MGLSVSTTQPNVVTLRFGRFCLLRRPPYHLTRHDRSPTRQCMLLTKCVTGPFGHDHNQSKYTTTLFAHSNMVPYIV
jgi:hypothetical protein